MHLKRRRGATLGFVAIIVLVLIMLGVGFFVLMKILGGGREMANSVDAGTLNLAKHAFLEPSKAARDFTNPDVANNFELLGDNGKLRLENYNRLVAQSMIVALNAKEEGTSSAAANAQRVWTAVNDVARFLRTNHANPAVMGGHFQSLAAANNLKMMGQNGISLNGYDVAYTQRTGSTNVFIDPRLLSTFTAGALPKSTGKKSPTGHEFLAGYSPLSVTLSSGTLVFSGVPVSPQDRPHLISGFTFDGGKDPAFMPGYPAAILPPNSFRSAGQTKESHTQTFGGAVASAIVGSLDREYEAAIPNGYIEVTNGPNLPPRSTDTAHTESDIFSHALAGLGIDMTTERDWFCRGSDKSVSESDIKAYNTAINKVPNRDNMFNEMKAHFQWSDSVCLERTIEILNMTDNWNARTLIDRWYDVNKVLDSRSRSYMRWKDIPNCQNSKDYIRRGDGSRITNCEDFWAIDREARVLCKWTNFMPNSAQIGDPCVPMLNNFQRGYGEWGSPEFHQSSGDSSFTALEKFKTDVLVARKSTQCCSTVNPSSTPSGVKRFQHGINYPAPLNPHNFGQVVSPKRLLEHIDSAPGGDGCGIGSTLDLLTKRCQQMKPSIVKEDVIRALNTKDLPVDATFYLYVQNGSLIMSEQKPPSAIAGTTPDGEGGTTQVACGSAYDVMGKLVNTSSFPPIITNNPKDFYDEFTGYGKKIAKLKPGIDNELNSFSDIKMPSSKIKKVWVDPPGEMSTADVPPYKTDRDERTDGFFPGWCFRMAPPATCQDKANWIPSSGFNNLLGRLYFTNQCFGGGQFCQPN